MSTPDTTTERLLTYREIHARTSIPIGTLHWLVGQKRIPHLRLGDRFVRFRWPDIERWLDSKVQPPLEPVANRGRR